MPRGGRRRRGRRPASSPPVEQKASQGRGRRSRGPRGPRLTVDAALAAMSSRPKTLQTLPEDGTVLEELIENMQTEYGTPTTPQEYRLIIKFPTEEEVRPAPQRSEVASPAVPGSPSKRRRRRRRRSGGDSEAPGPQDGSAPVDTAQG